MRNEEGQKMFRDLSSNNPNLLQILSKDNICSAGRKWLKEVHHMICMSFKKIRISNIKTPLQKETRDLFTRSENIKSKLSKLKQNQSEEGEKLRAELKNVDESIADIEAKENYSFVKNVKFDLTTIK